MAKTDKYKPITILFKTPNGNEWEEIHTYRLLDIFKKDSTVKEIRDTDTDNIIYSKEENK